MRPVADRIGKTVRVLDPEQMRAHTRDRFVELSFPDPPPHLPILFEPAEGYSLRPIDDVVARTVVLNVAIAVSYGMPRDLARRWTAQNGVEEALSTLEAAVIDGDEDVSAAEVGRQLEVTASADVVRAHA